MRERTVDGFGGSSLVRADIDEHRGEVYSRVEVGDEASDFLLTEFRLLLLLITVRPCQVSPFVRQLGTESRHSPEQHHHRFATTSYLLSDVAPNIFVEQHCSESSIRVESRM